VTKLANLDGRPVFETERLRCRRWLPSDVDTLFTVYSDEEGARWVDDGLPISRDECEQWLRVTDVNYSGHGYGMFALECLRSGDCIGFIGLVHPGGQVDAEIKYAFLRSHWDRGLASEAALAMLEYGAQILGLTRIIATVAPENLASQKVLQKGGMVLVDTREDEDGTPTQYYEWDAEGDERR
jgi:RimJ/RimL family protein N-acetyltransferase